MRLTLGFGILVLIGGLIGFFTAGSVASIIASSIFAALLFVASWGLSSGEPWGYYLAFVTGAILALFFINRAFQTHAPVPIIMALLSLLFTAFLFYTKKM